MLKRNQLCAMTVTKAATPASEQCSSTHAAIAQSMPHLECLDRFNQLPVVETAVDAVGKFYSKLKRSNSMAEWTLNTAEAGVTRMAHTLAPPLAVPIHLADSALCLSLSLMEDNLPAVKLPPQELLACMRSAVRDSADALARPMLRRASSVREIAARRVHEARDIGLLHANQVMRTRVGSIAADGLEKGLGLAEQLLDTYLPDDVTVNGVAGDEQTSVQYETDQYQQQVEDDEEWQDEDEDNRALHTVHRVDRLTRKLQRRLTRRTLAQVKSLREHGMDAVRYLLGLTYTAVTEPRASAALVASLWAELSCDEPENQPPPETLEQRTALLAREAARRVVHLVNAIAAMPGTAAATCSQLLIEILHGLRLDGPVHLVMSQSRQRYEQIDALVRQLSSLTDQFMPESAQVSVVRQWKQQEHQQARGSSDTKQCCTPSAVATPPAGKFVHND